MPHSDLIIFLDCYKNCYSIFNLYKGYIGGKAYYKPGSGTNYLCLPENPEWRKYTSYSHPWSGHIYGANYQIVENKPFPKKMNKKIAVCAVCKSTGRPTTLMIPAKWSCPKDWHTEYQGYLMSQSEWPKRPATHYICLDEHIQGINYIGKYKQARGILYPVEAVCGSLPCKKYSGHKELTCVVCSQ